MSENDSLIRDTESRKKIISETDKNFFVEAGAGSGKTTMLVNRMVAMVEAGVPIEEICAITFTKAAAGEFYERFQKMLIERSNPDYEWDDTGRAGQLPEPDDSGREKCKTALQNIDLCFMGTIDAFCAMILSEHPSEAGIPSDAVLVSDKEAEDFYRKQYVKICKGVYGNELEKSATTFNKLYRNAEEVFARGMSVLMGNRNVDFHFPEIKETDIDKVFASDRAELINVVNCLTKIFDLKYEGNKESINAWKKINEVSRNICKKWSTNLSDIIYALKILKNIQLIPQAMDEFGSVLGGLFKIQGKEKTQRLVCTVADDGGILGILLNIQYCSSLSFLRACVEPMENAMLENGYMTYFDYLYYLREMLRSDAGKNGGKLIEHIYNRHKYFLIDEFQDTNPLQAEIFFYLTSKKPVSKWTDCKPGQGSLFIVGDPKQSIYRFRGADVNSFLRVKALFENGAGEVLSLSRNHRSVKCLCEYYNRVFTSLMPKDLPGQGVYEDIPLPEERNGEFSGVFKYTAYTEEKLKEEHPDETDPVRIADIIERLVDNKDYLIRTGNDNEPRRIRYRDIMVITKAKDALKPVMEMFCEKEIPFRVEGKVLFGANEALDEISRIFSSVADTDDKISLYGALTGKLTGLTKEDILIFRQNGGRVCYGFSFDAKECENETACRVAEKIKELSILSHEAKGMSPASLFSKIMNDHRIYEIVNAEDLEVVYYTLELLRNAEQSGNVLSLKDGADYLMRLMSGESDEERCLSLTEDGDAVHMANLHKVKGLEAPIVIISAAKGFMNKNDKRIEHGDNGSEGYIFNLPKNNSGASKGYYFETKEFSDKADEEKAAGKAENDRLLYVAATRARNVLIIHEDAKKTKSGEPCKNAWTPLTEDGLPDIFEHIIGPAERAEVDKEGSDAAALYEDAMESCVFKERDTFEEETYLTENPSRLKLVSKLSDNDETVIDMEDAGSGTIDKNESKASSTYPALLGTMVHKLMEMLVSAKDKADRESVVDGVIKEYCTPEIESHLKDLKKALSDVEDKIKNGGYAQTNAAPGDILGTMVEADEVYCEVPFTYVDKKQDKQILWNGIMDLVYLKDGKWHILDYKTNADGSDLDIKYQEQLKAYVKAFKEITGNDADAMTYHIDV